MIQLALTALDTKLVGMALLESSVRPNNKVRRLG